MKVKINYLHIILSLSMTVILLSSCHSDPKIEPKKDGKDKGGSYSQAKINSSIVIC